MLKKQQCRHGHEKRYITQLLFLVGVEHSALCPSLLHDSLQVML